MSEVSKDSGIATALLTEFTSHRLPRAQALKAKVDRGESLEESDIAFLKDVFNTGEQIKALMDRHPEYQDVYAQATKLYAEITEKALANERAAHPSA
jgi:hypothetical protein